MFGFFGGAKKPLKGYKITAVDRKHKYGIAANSLKMLKDKASAKLKVRVILMLNHEFLMILFGLQIDDCRVYLAKDGTEIQDENYFETIEPQTLFIIASAETEVKTGMKIHYQFWINLDLRVFSIFIIRFSTDV